MSRSPAIVAAAISRVGGANLHDSLKLVTEISSVGCVARLVGRYLPECASERRAGSSDKRHVAGPDASIGHVADAASVGIAFDRLRDPVVLLALLRVRIEKSPAIPTADGGIRPPAIADLDERPYPAALQGVEFRIADRGRRSSFGKRRAGQLRRSETSGPTTDRSPHLDQFLDDLLVVHSAQPGGAEPSHRGISGPGRANSRLSAAKCHRPQFFDRHNPHPSGQIPAGSGPSSRIRIVRAAATEICCERIDRTRIEPVAVGLSVNGPTC